MSLWICRVAVLEQQLLDRDLLIASLDERLRKLEGSPPSLSGGGRKVVGAAPGSDAGEGEVRIKGAAAGVQSLSDISDESHRLSMVASGPASGKMTMSLVSSLHAQMRSSVEGRLTEIEKQLQAASQDREGFKESLRQVKVCWAT